MSSSSTTLSLDHLPPSEQLCFVHCNICDTVLVVSAPFTSLFKDVTIRCGHCTNLLPVNMRGLLLPRRINFIWEEMPNPSQKFFMNQTNTSNDFSMPASKTAADELPRPLIITRPPEKRQRVPSAYNRFIKDEIQRIKSVNPDTTHREAFSAAAKNWGHFRRLHFGHMPDQTVKKTNVHQKERRFS